MVTPSELCVTGWLRAGDLKVSCWFHGVLWRDRVGVGRRVVRGHIANLRVQPPYSKIDGPIPLRSMG